jgi:hypothetical protein
MRTGSQILVLGSARGRGSERSVTCQGKTGARWIPSPAPCGAHGDSGVLRGQAKPGADPARCSVGAGRIAPRGGRSLPALPAIPAADPESAEKGEYTPSASTDKLLHCSGLRFFGFCPVCVRCEVAVAVSGPGRLRLLADLVRPRCCSGGTHYLFSNRQSS